MAQFAGADDWDGVWDEYDLRQRVVPAAAVVIRLPGQDAVGRGTARPRVNRFSVLLALLVVSGAAVWLGSPWLIAFRIAPVVDGGNPREMMPYLDLAALRRSAAAELRPAGPRDNPPGTESWLNGMAAEMAAAWGEPEAVAAWLRLRARPNIAPRDGAVPGLGRLRAAQRNGITAARLDYEGGVGLEVSWSGGDVRVVGVRFGDR
ncbi:hypothetical protein [Roseomonas sp. BN140053]|uniref:hypothetical protein n=1 Tax=Roseomonas sp. BN140053 TaxID=3391898 RepID=UPI0039E9EB87